MQFELSTDDVRDLRMALLVAASRARETGRGEDVARIDALFQRFSPAPVTSGPRVFEAEPGLAR